MMRPLYFFLKVVLKPLLWVYYPYQKYVNMPKKRYSRTIFMSNHAASFMDPLIIGGGQSPIVFFMTRADIFVTWMKPILWASHMLPIYRQHDGKDTKSKNEEVFKTCSRVLSFGRSLLIFAEGFTDDEFVRRLKPVKKGSVRIGFTALEEINWKKKIYIQAIGINYSDPNKIGGDCLVSNGDPVCLNDFKEEYEKDPNKVVHELTELMEKDMRNQLTDIRDIEMCSFHENIMRITRKGMNADDTDRSIHIKDRWKYSKRLADWFNTEDKSQNEELMALKARLEKYFETLDSEGVKETPLYNVVSNKRDKWREILYLILMFPVMLIGLIHAYLPYKFTKNLMEKSFRRKVFWGSVKMMVGFAFFSVYNILLFVAISLTFGISFWLLFFVGYLAIPVIGVIAYNWFKKRAEFKMMNKITKSDYSKISLERQKISREIKRLIPIA